MSLKRKIRLYGQTDIGIHRDHNEDTIGCNEDLALMVLADGMGGHRCGEIASAIAVNTVIEHIKKESKKVTINSNSKEYGSDEYKSIIHEAIKLANRNIYDSAQTNKQYEGMGTTIVTALFYNNTITVAHVGDSRLYRFRNNKLKQITKDHSYVQELIDCGVYTSEQAKTSEHKNLITRAVGIERNIKIELKEYRVEVGDIYFICSDGVSDLVDDEHIKSILIEHSNDLKAATSTIINTANNMGGKDNISVYIAKPIKSFPQKINLLSKLINLIKHTFSTTTVRNING